MVFIKQATFGDEASATDITASIQKKVTKGYLDIIADSKLLPMITLDSTTATLTDSDKEMAKQQAIQQCGGNAHDQRCIDERTGKIEQSLLQTRVSEQNATDKVIKGRRLTMTLVDDTGKERTVQVPDGQEFKLGNPPPTPITMGSITSFLVSLVPTLWSALLLFGWVFSVIATYRTLIQAGYQLGAYAGTVAAVLIPYSGFAIMLGFFAIKSYYANSSKPT
jgi:hypothetical protein